MIGDGSVRFSVLTLNLWNVSEPLAVRYAALEKGLKRLRPDIVCLQEADRDPRSGQSQSRIVADMCGHEHIFQVDGLAIASSMPLVRPTSAPLPQFAGDFPRYILSAELRIGGRRLSVSNTHLAYPPEMGEERKIQTEALLAAIKSYQSAERCPQILCGDFNDIPDSQAVQAVLQSDHEFHDVFAECHPGKPGFTYACHNPYVDRSWTIDERIDYIFVSRDLAAETCSVVFDGNEGLDLVSDHFGVFCRAAFRT